jgi:CRISPR type III-A-associated protein Csm2
MAKMEDAFKKAGLATDVSRHPEKDNKDRQKGSSSMTNYFYEDDRKEIIREDLLTSRARQWAKSFIKPSRLGRNERNPRLTSAQLRKFYNDVKSLETQVESRGFAVMRPLVKMMKSKVAYACASTGKDRKVPVEFRQYIEEMVDSVEDMRDFKAFALCFESVVGYFYGEGGR